MCEDVLEKFFIKIRGGESGSGVTDTSDSSENSHHYQTFRNLSSVTIGVNDERENCPCCVTTSQAKNNVNTSGASMHLKSVDLF